MPPFRDFLPCHRLDEGGRHVVCEDVLGGVAGWKLSQERNRACEPFPVTRAQKSLANLLPRGLCTVQKRASPPPSGKCGIIGAKLEDLACDSR